MMALDISFYTSTFPLRDIGFNIAVKGSISLVNDKQ